MNYLDELKERLEKEQDLSGRAYDDWDNGWDAALRWVSQVIVDIEKKDENVKH
jgi:hypothetical protein